jgi:hypothetical protein
MPFQVECYYPDFWWVNLLMGLAQVTFGTGQTIFGHRISFSGPGTPSQPGACPHLSPSLERKQEERDEYHWNHSVPTSEVHLLHFRRTAVLQLDVCRWGQRQHRRCSIPMRLSSPRMQRTYPSFRLRAALKLCWERRTLEKVEGFGRHTPPELPGEAAVLLSSGHIGVCSSEVGHRLHAPWVAFHELFYGPS